MNIFFWSKYSILLIIVTVLLRKSAEMTLVDKTRFIFSNYDPKNDYKAPLAALQANTAVQTTPISSSTEVITNALEIAPSQTSDTTESNTVANSFINKQGVAFQSPENCSPQGK